MRRTLRTLAPLPLENSSSEVRAINDNNKIKNKVKRSTVSLLSKVSHAHVSIENAVPDDREGYYFRPFDQHPTALGTHRRVGVYRYVLQC